MNFQHNSQRPLELINLFNSYNSFNRCGLSALLFLALIFGFTASLQAQFPGGGFQFGGGQNNNNRSRSTGGQYPNNQVGDAVISIDPETRSMIVIADDETSQYISQVVSNLDRPKPQVLIKVVFLEVSRSDSLDIGIEGSFGKDIGNDGIVTGYRTNFVSVPAQSRTGNSTNVFISGNTIVPTNLTSIIRGVSLGNAFGLANSGGPAGLYQIFSRITRQLSERLQRKGRRRFFRVRLSSLAIINPRRSRSANRSHSSRACDLIISATRSTR